MLSDAKAGSGPALVELRVTNTANRRASQETHPGLTLPSLSPGPPNYTATLAMGHMLMERGGLGEGKSSARSSTDKTLRCKGHEQRHRDVKGR